MIRGLVPSAQLACLASDANETVRATILAYGGGELSALAKVVSSERDRALLRHEADMLRALGRIPRMQPNVPKLLGEPEFHLGSAIVTDSFSGTPCPTKLVHSLRSWLEKCVTRDNVRVSSTSIFRRSHAIEQRSSKVDEARKKIESLYVHRTIVHGDFAPWNIIMVGDIPGVFDWEYGTTDGIPEWDSLYFVAQVSSVIHSAKSRLLAETMLKAVARGTPYWPSSEAFHAVAILVLSDLAQRSSARGEVERARLIQGAIELL